MEHPESYRVHQAAERVMTKLGRTRAALSEYGVSAELYPLEVGNLVEAARAAADAGDAPMARRFLAEADHSGLGRPLVDWVRAYVDFRTGSSAALLAEARAGVAAAPLDPTAARILAGAYLAAGWPDSARAVWPAFLRRGGRAYEAWLFRSSTFVALGLADSAHLALDSATRHAPPGGEARADLARLRVLIAPPGPAGPPLQ